MKFRILLLILTSLITTNLTSQISKFQTIHSDGGSLNPNDVIQLEDGTYITLETGSSGMIFSLLNYDGTLAWSKEITFPGMTYMTGCGVHEKADGNIVITGSYQDSNGYWVFALKYDLVNQMIIWNKSYNLSASNAIASKSIHTRDNSILLCGGYYNGVNNVGFIIKISDTGTEDWMREYTGGFNMDIDRVIDVVETNAPLYSNMYYVLFEQHNTTTSKYGAYVAYINGGTNQGAYVSKEMLNTYNTYDVTGVSLCNYGAGNGCLVIGKYDDGTYEHNLIYHFDGGLTLQNCYTYSCSSPSLSGFAFTHVSQMFNGNYLVGGNSYVYSSVFGQIDAIFMEMDNSLTPLKGNIYGDTLTNTVKAMDFTSDSGWVSIGDNIDANSMTPSNSPQVIRADKDFLTGCSESTVTFSSSSVTATTNIPSVSSAAASYTSSIVTPTITPVTLTENMLCTTPVCKIAVSGTVTDTYCAYGNGAINVTETGGFSPVTYSWSTGATTEDLTSLAVGSYIVTATDSNGCTATQTFTVNGSDPISVSTSNYVYPTCYDSYDGSVNLTVNTGTAPYTISWYEFSGYGSYSFTGEDPTGMPSGDYDLYITDNNGCTFDTTISVYGPYPVTVNLDYSTDPSCTGSSDGLIAVYGDGGNYTYTYQWDAATGNQTGSTANGLTAGAYSVVITDGNGCTGNGSFSIVDPTPLQSSATSVDVLCNGQNNGSINVTTSGGTPPYSFSWSSGQTTEDISNIIAGSYDITVTDNNNCTLTSTYTVNQPGVLLSPITAVDALCNGQCNGQLTANPTGGTPPYTYIWNDPTGQTAQTAVNLCAGTYSVNVADANNCQVTPSGTVNEPAILTVSLNTTNSTCGDDNGIAEAITNGGTPPYTYTWSVTGSSNPIMNLAPGNYGVSVDDANGCSEQANFTISDTIYPINICVVTVDTSSTKNTVVWEKPVVGNIASYNIYRDIVGTYTLVGNVPYDSLSQFTDTTNGINPNVTSYRYKITAVDTCGNESILSELHETIHLTVNQGTSNESNLIWDAYQGINFVYYRIMRDTILDGSWEAMDSVTSSNFTYTDWDVFTNGANYMIEIVLPYTCTSTKQQSHNTTRSNRVIIAGGSTSGVEELLLNQAEIYPNPFNNELTINVGTTNWSYSVLDVAGKLIINGLSKQSQQQLDLSLLENGVYFVQLKIGDHTITKKLIKD